MRAQEMLKSLFRNRAAALGAGVALALAVMLLLAVTARADENHGNSAHNVTMSCSGTVDEGDTAVVTLTRGDSATKRIKGTLRADFVVAQGDDFDSSSRNINHNGDEIDVEIDTTDDTAIEGDESFRMEFVNDHNGAKQSCQILILDDDDVNILSVSVTSEPESDDVYGLGEIIQFTLVLDHEVDARNSAYIGFEVITGRDYDYTNRIYRSADYASGSGSDTIIYEYEVKSWDLDLNGLSISSRCGLCGLPGLRYAGTNTNVSTIAGFGQQNNLSGHKIDGRPRITGFEITSTPEDGEAYRFREQIVVEMTLDAGVKVYGTPGLKLALGDETEWAVYDADRTDDANDSAKVTTVIFVHDVGPTDKATDGVEVTENTTSARSHFVIPDRAADLDNDGNEIKVRFEVFKYLYSTFWAKTQAHYDHDGLDADSDHAVDATVPLIEITIGSVGGSLGATLAFWNIPNDEGDLTWRADLKSEGADKDDCESTNMGADNTIAEEDLPELGESIERTINVTSSCNAGTYTIEVTATVDGDEVADASKSFQINLSWLPGD